MINNVKLRLAVVGSRDWDNYEFIFQTLDKYKEQIAFLISGGANGADEAANIYARKNGIPIVIHYPKWQNEDGTTNKMAGFDRNTRIIKHATKVLAFQKNKSRGTQDSIDKAVSMGKDVEIYEI